jgi:hypothetical protein
MCWRPPRRFGPSTTGYARFGAKCSPKWDNRICLACGQSESDSRASGDSVLRTFIVSVQKPKIDDRIRLLTDFGETEGICSEVHADPAIPGATLLKLMARGPFSEGQQLWILDRDGSKVGATVKNVFKQTIDSEVTLSAVLPA